MIREAGEKPLDIFEKFALPVALYVSCSAYDHLVTGILIPGRILVRQYMELPAFPSKTSPTLPSKQRSEAIEAPQLPMREMLIH